MTAVWNNPECKTGTDVGIRVKKKPFLKEKELIANSRNYIRTCCLPA